MLRAPIQTARQAGLHYRPAETGGFRRQKRGKGFSILDTHGRPVKNKRVLQRVRSLAIPPAYKNVWITADPRAHLQATGRDARGRKQYRYHPRWREVRDGDKFEEMIEFARLLPLIRRTTHRHLGLAGLPRPKVLATVVQLLERTLIRVGNEEYARDNHSYGVTTLQNRHVRIFGAHLRFKFTGKSGVPHDVELDDSRLARIIQNCRELPGHDLLQYLDENGQVHSIGSSDVNAYLKEITGAEITAKDFRTWAGTVQAARLLSAVEREASQRKNKVAMNEAIGAVARQLRNTPTICRKCYIHPAVLEAYVGGVPILTQFREPARKAGRVSARPAYSLSALEREVLAFVRKSHRKNTSY